LTIRDELNILSFNGGRLPASNPQYSKSWFWSSDPCCRHRRSLFNHIAD